MTDGQYSDSLMPVNYVMLAVVAGIIGLVLTGFTGWHILLASRGQTTIECLEKTRYLSPSKKAQQHRHIVGDMENGEQGHQFRDISPHSLAVSNYEMRNGEQRQHITYDDLERQRARARYEEYLDEQDSEKLPSAFDLGWRRNFAHLFGPSRILWFFPICNTTGDGWSWEPSPKWLEARDRVAGERRAQRSREQAAGWGGEPEANIPITRTTGAGRHYSKSPMSRSPSKADRILGRSPSEYTDQENAVSLQNMRRKPVDDPYDISSDEEEAERKALDRKAAHGLPRRIGVVTNAMLGNTLARQKDDVRGWDGQDEGVD